MSQDLKSANRGSERRVTNRVTRDWRRSREETVRTVHVATSCVEP